MEVGMHLLTTTIWLFKTAEGFSRATFVATVIVSFPDETEGLFLSGTKAL